MVRVGAPRRASGGLRRRPGRPADRRDPPGRRRGPPLPELPDPAHDVARFVDPLIGTAGPGNVIPGALVPHGMVRISPVTVAEAGPVTAYDNEAPGILGFSHSHIEGAGGGANGYSQLLVAPVLGTLSVDAAGAATASSSPSGSTASPSSARGSATTRSSRAAP